MFTAVQRGFLMVTVHVIVNKTLAVLLILMSYLTLWIRYKARHGSDSRLGDSVRTRRISSKGSVYCRLVEAMVRAAS